MTVHIDASRIVKMAAYVPILDEEFEQVLDYEAYRRERIDPAKLAGEVADEKRRLDRLYKRVQEMSDPAAERALRRVYSDRMVEEVEEALALTANDGEAAQRALARLKELKTALDAVDDALEWPSLLAEAEKELGVERNIVEEPDMGVTREEKAEFTRLEHELRAAIARRDPDGVRHGTKELDRLGFVIVMRRPSWWVSQVGRMEEKRGTMTDRSGADSWLNKARRAIQEDDLEGLKSAVRQLWALLPAGDPDRARAHGSTVIR